MISVTENDLIRHINIGKLPVIIYRRKQYEGIYCMLKVTKCNKLFLDYSDADDDGGFRASFVYDSLEALISSVEKYTGLSLSQLEIESQYSDDFICDTPEWTKFQWDVYNGRIKFPENYSTFSIGDLWWRGLYKQAIKPGCSSEELDEWIKKESNYDDE